MHDNRATKRPKPHVPPNALRPTLAGGELVTVLIAFMSGLVLLGVRDFSEHNPFDPTTSGSRFQAVRPHLLVIALAATGFSRIGDPRRRLVGLGASAAVALIWYLLALRA